MPGLKTNERPGTRAVLRHYRMSATKARQVLDLVRGQEVDRAHDILRATPREGARVVAKVLESAVSNARNNDGLDPDELYVSACYADEGTTMKRWRPRARGRATRIRKRTSHITVIVSRLPDDRLARRRARQAASSPALRSRRVAASRREQVAAEAAEAAEVAAAEQAEERAEELDALADEDDVAGEEAVAAEVETATEDSEDTTEAGAEAPPAPKRGRRRSTKAKAEPEAEEAAEESD
jgi:large subunit ribosomal protein L22